ncbi:MAG TPA: patatin-like phospholipase family protein [Steroidobacteraceae bacterium]
MNARQELRQPVTFEAVVRREREYIGLAAASANPQGAALALSGGGIRSASFALGVVQALANVGSLKRFHYLSTVSGGGYLGTALTWLKRQYGADFEAQLGSPSRGDRTADLRRPGMNRKEEAPSRTWLDYVRLHGNYLKPPKITALSLVGVALRGMLFSVLVYGGAAVALLAVLSGLHVLPTWCEAHCAAHPWYSVERWAIWLGFLLGFQVLLYGLATWLTSVSAGVTLLGAVLVTVALAKGLWQVWPGGPELWSGQWPFVVALAMAVLACAVLTGVAALALRRRYGATAEQLDWVRSWHYRMRTVLQQSLGATLGLTLALLVLYSIPGVYTWLRGLALWAPGAAGAGSTVLTGIGALWRFVARRNAAPGSAAPSGALMKLVPVLVAALVIYGVLVLAYAVQAGGFVLPFSPAPQNVPALTVFQGWIVGAAALFTGLLCNVNYVSLGRVYRDRLMEMFMPNRRAIERSQWEKATEAESVKVADILVPSEAGRARLFHLINCNVVMVDARRDSFRARGGDSFVFSPLYSGSSATGWISSGVIGGTGLPLATAMATSGAAANPDAGGAGQGITRNRLVSFLMWFFNVRLGYWLRNPGAPWQGKIVGFGPPNFWFPGLWQGLLGRRLRESAAFVELTDGGHFDNTALYELIRRRVQVIVLSEAGADPEYRMDDLANAIERVRVDFGVHVRFDVPGFEAAAIRPRDGKDDPMKGYAERGFALASIYYPPLQAKDDPEAPHFSEWGKGALLYLQASKIDAVRKRVDIDAYARAHADFPNESTADQFFDEDQLEAYRELGMEVVEQALERFTKTTAADPEAVTALAQALLGS